MQLAPLAQRYLTMGWRHRWKALALAWLICLPGWVGVYLLPSRFEANARIYADADAVLGALLRGIAIDSSPASQVDLLQRTLLSRPNLEKVIARTDLDMRVNSVASREALLESLAKNIKIALQTRNLFTISFADHNPRLARDVVQTVLNLFLEAAAVTDKQQMENARAFLNQQLVAYESQLREAEQRRAEFRSRYIDLLPDGTTGATGLEQARAKLQQLRGDLEDAQKRQTLTRQQLEATPVTLSPAEVAGGGGDGRVAEAQRKLQELQLRFTDEHPDVVAARNAIAQLRASGGGSRVTLHGPSVANPLYEQLKIRMVDVDAQVASLQRQIRDGTAEINRMEALARNAPQLQAQFTDLDRDYNVRRKNYQELLERREALQIAGAARTGADRVKLEIIDPPTIPTVPVGPKRTLFAAAVLLMGIGAGAAVALLYVHLDTTFYTVLDLRALGLPVLGSVSSAQNRGQPIKGVFTFAGAFVLLLVAFAGLVAGGTSLVTLVPSLLAKLGV